jgi:hypothetical protein
MNLPFVDFSTVNKSVTESVLYVDFEFLRYMPRNDMTEAYVISTLEFQEHSFLLP